MPNLWVYGGLSDRETREMMIREETLNRVAGKIYELLRKNEVSASEFSHIFQIVRKEVMERAKLRNHA